MCLKQERATTAELVRGVLKREQLKCEVSQIAKAVWEKQAYVRYCFRQVYKLTFCSHLSGVRIKRDTNGELVSPAPHPDTIIHPKECAAAILAQVDWEMAQIKERDRHWEDGIEVCCLHTIMCFSHILAECIPAPALTSAVPGLPPCAHSVVFSFFSPFSFCLQAPPSNTLEPSVPSCRHLRACSHARPPTRAHTHSLARPPAHARTRSHA